jgi:hypothetical protein
MIRQETLCFPDISKWRNKLKLEEVSEAQQRDKVKFIDNPYIAGRQKEHLDPHTGLEKPSQQKKANSNGKLKGQNFQGKQGCGQWEPYPSRDNEQPRQWGGGEASRYHDYRNCDD